jgi:hypothetical protein
MRVSQINHRKNFLTGALIGFVLVIFKLVVFLPINVADIMYGIALLVTLVITTGEILESKRLVLEAKYLDFIMGILFPLDAYAVLILLGLPLTN